MRIINVLLSIFALFFLVFILYIALQRFENSQSSFNNFSELAQSALIQNGWLPEYFPRSAINIKEKHNFDSNEVFASFQFDDLPLSALLQHCSLVAEFNDSFKLLCKSHFQQTNIFVLNKQGHGQFMSIYNGL